MLINHSLKKINPNATIVVANNRQVIALKKTYQKQSQNNSYQIPKITIWQDFLTNLYHQLESPPFLISNTMQFALWLEIIKDESLTKKALEDYKLIADYNLKINSKLVDKKFYNWFNQYQQKLQKENWLDNNKLANFLLDYNFEKTDLFFYGFNHWTTQQQQILAKIEHQELKHTPINPTINTYTFPSIDDELLACAIWAKNNNDKSIAIVVNDLKEIKHKIILTFDEVFKCNQQFLESYEKPYNISLGNPLSEEIISKNLLSLFDFAISFAKDNIQPKLLQNILLSPLIKQYSTEQELRATASNHKSFSKLILTKKEVLEITKDCHIINNILQNLPTLNDWQTTNNYQQWQQFFNNIINLFEFSTETYITNNNELALNKIQTVFKQLNSLQPLKHQLNANEFLALFKQLLEQTIFQTKSPKTNIHILGLLEAQGLNFDKVWFINFHQKSLPAKVKKPHFIYYSFAKTQSIPNITHQSCYKNAEILLKDLQQLSSDIRFSYSKQNNESLQQKCLMINWEHNNFIQEENKKPQKEFTEITDNIAPKIDNKKIKQGVKILSEQAQCQFKAFSNRLRISETIEEEIGFSNLEKGNIMHKVLEKILPEKTTKETLQTLTRDDIKNAIRNEINYYQKKQTIKNIETKRLLHILQKFIDLELKRDAWIIEKVEDKQSVNIKGLEFDIRLDRMDKVDEKTIIFDYKSSANKSANLLLNTPLKEPQLPIYAINKNVQSIAFICLTTLEIKYIGLGDLVPFNKGKPKAMKDWQEELSQTSIDFQNGLASVLPTKDICKYCNLKSLCRIEV
ncbi:RecB family exonuclease [hydrothermal vent metagenome]|uniref:RecB family exonuclease n=1 Tax=hydrothermal vent metagenome TaxID=652676 RepID=A0A1W1CMC1_9ZZZZ